LKAFKENVEGEVEEFMKECNNSTEIIHDKLASMEQAALDSREVQKCLLGY
jgi:hypothetical protein